MRVNVSARHFKASDRLQEFATNEVMRLTKLYDRITEGEIILDWQKGNKQSEIILNVNGTTLTATDISTDFYKSIPKTVDKLESQLRKFKGKLTKKQ